MTGSRGTESLIPELTASGLFDAARYLRCNDDVSAAGKEPLAHFAGHGWAEKRWPTGISTRPGTG